MHCLFASVLQSEKNAKSPDRWWVDGFTVFAAQNGRMKPLRGKRGEICFAIFFCGVGGFMFYVNCLLTWFILYQAEIGNKLTCRILHIEAETSSSMNLKQHRQTQKLENIGGQRNIMIVIYNHRVFSNICMHTYTFVSCESWKGSLVIQTFHTSAEFPGPEGWRIKRFIAPLAFGMFLGWMMRWV